MRRVFLDTNILIDLAMERGPKLILRQPSLTQRRILRTCCNTNVPVPPIVR